ncbi:MAG: TRL domain-containing protein [Planctomycetota bacterium]
MSRIILLSIALSLFIVGCVGLPVPVGGLYTNATVPHSANGGPGGKTGEAKVGFIIGIVTGDASIKAAANAGGISDVKTVDYKIFNILGVYGHVTTVVTGD